MKKNFKVIKVIFIIFIFLLSLIGCGKDTSSFIFYLNPGDQTINSSEKFKALSVPGEFIIKRKSSYYRSNNINNIYSMTSNINPSRPSIRLIKRISQLNAEVISFQSNKEDILKQLQNDPSIEYIEPNYIRRILINDFYSRKNVSMVNDPRRIEQYALDKLKAEQTWKISSGENVIVAIIDTGIDINHPDLKDRIVQGYSTVVGVKSPIDDNGHGTHVAGIIGATSNNKIGIAGIAPLCKLMPIKVLSREGAGNDASISEGIIWAVDHGASVINMSLGGPGESKTLLNAIQYALKKNVVVVSAMGNDSQNIKNYPAAYQDVIAVGSSDKNDNWSEFSNFGDWICVNAPGSEILSTFPTYQVELNDYGFTKEYAILDGTSQAAPYISGVIALLQNKFKGKISYKEVIRKIQDGVDDLGTPGFDPKFGYGRINPLKVLTTS